MCFSLAFTLSVLQHSFCVKSASTNSNIIQATSEEVMANRAAMLNLAEVTLKQIDEASPAVCFY